MSYPLSIELQNKAIQNLKLQQRLIMSPQMQQAIHLLQCQAMELSAIVENELEQNPVVEIIQEGQGSDDPELTAYEQDVYENDEESDRPPEKELTFDENDFAIMKQLDEDFRDTFTDTAHKANSYEEEKKRSFLESTVKEEKSLFEHLMEQANESFDTQQEKAIAEIVIGNLDEKGFLETSLDEIALIHSFPKEEVKEVLKTIQTFEPYGIGAADLRESLMIQLRCLKKGRTIAYRLVALHYDDMLHNRLPVIKKSLGCTHKEITDAIENDISPLDLHPGMWYSKKPVQYIKPDVSVHQEEDKLVVEVNDDFWPTMRFNRRYMRMLEDPELTHDVKDFIKQKILSAKWLLKNIHQRNETLRRIVDTLTVRQKAFFMFPDGKLSPLTMKIVAEELDLHESTIARAVANKYIDTPRGVLALRSFFTVAYQAENGEELSSKTVKDALRDIIDKEDKKKPLSDNKISTMLKQRGIDCARRTIAKYRAELNIGNMPQRKAY